MALNVVETPDEPLCRHCRWWSEREPIGEDPSWGQCKGGPPVVLKPNGEGIWPMTLASEPACGVFQLQWESDET